MLSQDAVKGFRNDVVPVEETALTFQGRVVYAICFRFRGQKRGHWPRPPNMTIFPGGSSVQEVE